MKKFMTEKEYLELKKNKFIPTIKETSIAPHIIINGNFRSKRPLIRKTNN